MKRGVIMKNKIAILTDSSSTIYTFNHDYDNIFMINLPCYIGDETFTDFDKHGDKYFIRSKISACSENEPAPGVP